MARSERFPIAQGDFAIGTEAVVEARIARCAQDKLLLVGQKPGEARHYTLAVCLIMLIDAGDTGKKNVGEALRGRCDSFVAKTNVHYPNDISLLFDAGRKVIELTAHIATEEGLSGWRQHEYNVRHLKKHLRAAQRAKHRKTQNKEQQKVNDDKVIEAHRSYLAVAQEYLYKAQMTLDQVVFRDAAQLVAKIEINTFIKHANRQIDQTRRRVILGETIPHVEKVFSIFETHTEWISKGKAGVPVELGLRVCVIEDQYRFLLHYRVMEKQTDDQVAQLLQEVAMTLKTRPFDISEHLKDEKDIAAFITLVLEGGDPGELAHALGIAARAKVVQSTGEELPLVMYRNMVYAYSGMTGSTR